MSSRFSIRNIKTFSITDTDPEKEKEIKAKAEQKKREKEQRRIDEINLLNRKIIEYENIIKELEKKEKQEKKEKEDKEFWDGLDAKIEKLYPGGKLQKKKKTKTKKGVK
jgi:hypothetical protein